MREEKRGREERERERRETKVKSECDQRAELYHVTGAICLGPRFDDFL